MDGSRNQTFGATERHREARCDRKGISQESRIWGPQIIAGLPQPRNWSGGVFGVDSTPRQCPVPGENMLRRWLKRRLPRPARQSTPCIALEYRPIPVMGTAFGLRKTHHHGAGCVETGTRCCEITSKLILVYACQNHLGMFTFFNERSRHAFNFIRKSATQWRRGVWVVVAGYSAPSFVIVWRTGRKPLPRNQDSRFKQALTLTYERYIKSLNIPERELDFSPTGLSLQYAVTFDQRPGYERRL